MCFHRSLVKRRLSVEQHNISVNDVSVNDIAFLQVNRVRIHIEQTEGLLVFLNEDRFGSWMLLGSVANIA